MKQVINCTGCGFGLAPSGTAEFKDHFNVRGECKKRVGYDFNIPVSTIRSLHDPVNSPSHYKAKGGMEVIDVMEAFNTDRNISNVLKYILRAGNKDDELKDLCKARRWLNRKINALSGKKSWEEE